MTIADLITAVRVGDPQVSPDGQRVAFVRTTTDSATGKRNADIWVVAADGSSRPRPLIAGPGSDDTPRFLGDGRLAFISARSGPPQVYLADASGRHVRAVTRLSGGVQPPLVAVFKAIPGQLNGILRLHFCVWTDAETAWMTRATPRCATRWRGTRSSCTA